MKNLKKIIAVSFAIITLFIANSTFACTGSYYMCDSWAEKFIEDLVTNCEEYDVEVTWIEGC